MGVIFSTTGAAPSVQEEMTLQEKMRLQERLTAVRRSAEATESLRVKRAKAVARAMAAEAGAVAAAAVADGAEEGAAEAAATEFMAALEHKQAEHSRLPNPTICTLWDAVEDDDADLVRWFLEHGRPPNVQLRSPDHYDEGCDVHTALTLAASNNKINAARALIGHRAVDCNKTVHFKGLHGGQSPLYIAAQEGHVGVVELLLGARARAAAAAMAAEAGAAAAAAAATADGPAEGAAEAGAAEFMAALQKAVEAEGAADGKAGGAGGAMAAERARFRRYFQTSGHGASDVDIDLADDVGETPLYAACANYDVKGIAHYLRNRNEHLAIVRMLLAAGANADSADEYGTTPLYKVKREREEKV